ncbi:MAG: hypothetical protein OXG24_07465 [Gammaproteobacteria bacterium]|nr:hypothetical protein [Gammaproteobacteria bacterium]
MVIDLNCFFRLVTTVAFAGLVANNVCAQEANTSNAGNGSDEYGLVENTLKTDTTGEQNSPIPVEVMEEVIVRDKPLEFPNLQTFAERHLVHSRGEYYYRTRQYKKAFPYLLASARQGFKMAQARLGFIYQQGLGEVQRDGWRAVGWLGVAAHGDTDPSIRNYYRKILRKIPEELMPAVDAVVADFVKKYGPDATGMDCIMSRPAGSHIAKMHCNFELEFALQDVNSMLQGNSTGAIPTGVTGNLTGSSTPPAPSQ